MNKVVILSTQTQSQNFLISLLKMIFPECETDIIFFEEPNALCQGQRDIGGGGNYAEHPDYR
jgi:hypothetical protein